MGLGPRRKKDHLLLFVSESPLGSVSAVQVMAYASFPLGVTGIFSPLLAMAAAARETAEVIQLAEAWCPDHRSSNRVENRSNLSTIRCLGCWDIPHRKVSYGA